MTQNSKQNLILSATTLDLRHLYPVGERLAQLWSNTVLTRITQSRDVRRSDNRFTQQSHTGFIAETVRSLFLDPPQRNQIKKRGTEKWTARGAEKNSTEDRDRYHIGLELHPGLSTTRNTKPSFVGDSFLSTGPDNASAIKQILSCFSWVNTSLMNTRVLRKNTLHHSITLNALRSLSPLCQSRRTTQISPVRNLKLFCAYRLLDFIIPYTYKDLYRKYT